MLEQITEKESLMKEFGRKIKDKAAIALTITALAIAPAYLVGCDTGDEGACCEELSCTSYGSQECFCEYTSPHNSTKCVTNSDGQQECCSCTCYNDKY